MNSYGTAEPRLRVCAMHVPAEERWYEYKLNGRVIRLAGLHHRECEGNDSGGALAAAGHSTGQATWPAGELLCDYLASEEGRALLAGAHVAELGCGLGMCGLVSSALAGPSGSVLMTDGARAVAAARAWPSVGTST